MAMIGFGVPTIEQEDIDAVVEVLRSGWLIAGPRTRSFEEAVATYVGVEHAVAVNSATAALHLALEALRIGPGDEVVTSPLTFVATANAVRHVGATPVFADVDLDTHNLDAEALSAACSPRTKAVIPVQLAGRADGLAEVEQVAAEHGLAVVNDAAHALETIHRGTHVGARGSATAFSFQATKNVTTAEGGMVTTIDARLAERVRAMREHGLSKGVWSHHKGAAGAVNLGMAPGYNFRMSDVAAAMGVTQLSRVESNRARRQHNAKVYDAALTGHPAVRTRSVAEPPGERWAFHLYTIELDLDVLTCSRDEIAGQLRDAGLGTGVHYRPVHLMPYFTETFGHRPGQFPNAERIGASTLSLPVSPSVGPTDAQMAADILLQVLDRNSATTSSKGDG